MENHMTRRKFLAGSSLAAGVGMLAARGASGAPPAKRKLGEIKPCLYSITYLGYWYRGAALTMDQLLERAKKYGFAGIEIEGKRPHGCPLDWPKHRCVEYRKKVEDSGLVITDIAANNDFSSPIPEQRESMLTELRESMRMASDLGTKLIRVYMSWPGETKLPGKPGRYDIAWNAWNFLHKDFTDEETWDWCRAALKESARYAGDYGVTLALQNHGPVIKHYEDCLRLVHEVGSPHLKLCLDAPLFNNTSPEHLRKAIYDAGPLQVHSHYGGEFKRESPGGPIRPIRMVASHYTNIYKREGFQKRNIYIPFFQAMLETGYHGYVGYELCHPLPIVDGKTVGIDFVDSQTQLALEYIRDSIAKAKEAALANINKSA